MSDNVHNIIHSIQYTKDPINNIRYYQCYQHMYDVNCIKIDYYQYHNRNENDNTKHIIVSNVIPEVLDKYIIKQKWLNDVKIIK